MSQSDANAPPAICESCLGPSEHLRMLRSPASLECKLCTRPFTVYKWKPAANSPYKTTIICLTCSRQRNCCQCCLMDLTYGISIQMRDAALKMAGVKGISDGEPVNAVSKLYVADNEDKFKSIGGAGVTGDKEKAREVLTKLALIARGEKKAIEDNNNKEREEKLPEHIAKLDVGKIISKLPLKGSLKPPEDTKISTLFIFGLDSSLAEYKITDYFSQFGNVKSVACQHAARCAFVTFTKRQECEAAAKSLKPKFENGPGLLVLESIPLFVTWGKERDLGRSSGERAKVGDLVMKYIKKLNGSGSDTKKEKKRKVDNTSDKNEKTNVATKKAKVKALAKQITDKSFEL